MTTESLFFLANHAALVCWILLICLPRFPVVSNLAIPVVACGLLAVLYLFLAAFHLGGAEGGFSSLDGVAALFDDREILLAGWVHYLVFDLFVGSWMVRDARRHRIAHWMIVPALLLTFMLGPIGLLTYYAVRFIRLRQLRLE